MDAELLEKSDGEFGQSALDLVLNGSYGQAQRGGRSQREAYVNVRFVSE